MVREAPFLRLFRQSLVVPRLLHILHIIHLVFLMLTCIFVLALLNPFLDRLGIGTS